MFSKNNGIAALAITVATAAVPDPTAYPAPVPALFIILKGNNMERPLETRSALKGILLASLKQVCPSKVTFTFGSLIPPLERNVISI